MERLNENEILAIIEQRCERKTILLPID